MANRHRRSGGAVGKNIGGAVAYNAKDSNVLKEARERKHGGKVFGKHGGAAAKVRLDKRAHGGRVGADKHPFSSAHRGG